MSRKILVPVDGSEHANKAIAFAGENAKVDDALVHLLHVIKHSDLPKGLDEFIRSEGLHDTPSTVYFTALGDRIVELGIDEAKKAGIKNVESSIVEGDPAESIIEYGRVHDYDMIVIGSRGLGNIKGLLLGSVSTKVCHSTDRTCVTVK